MKDVYNLTTPQKSILLTEEFYGKTNVNNVCGTFYSNEKIDFELFKQAINIFLKNNDSFKIKLKQINGETKQYFSDIENIEFDIVEVNNKDEQTSLEEKIASKIFNLYDSLLFKIVLFRYPDGHGGFVINSHHIISDSWTNGIVANDVALIYSKLKNGDEYLKDDNLSYKKYIESEKEYKQSSKFEKDKLYWDEVFTTIPEVATIPSIKEASQVQDSTLANRLLLPLDNNILSSLKNYCEENKVSLYNFFMAIYALYIGRVSGLDEFVIGTPILNRTNFKEKQTTGMFINTLPLKINLVHENTFIENLKEISTRSMNLLRHQKYSFQYIIEDLRKKESNLPKLYNILYSYQITKMNKNMDSLEHTTSWTFNKNTADDLDIHMFEWNDEGSIQIAYDYRTNKYDEQDILDLHARILHVIKQVIENKSILLKDIEIVTPEEKNKILYEFNNTKADYPNDKTIVDLFEDQVEKTPDNIAVVFEEQKLTYKELNEKANSLARYLTLNELNKIDNIGIFTDRCIETIIGILAILKIGKTFVPIDPLYPKERISHIIDSAKLNCILYTSSNLYTKSLEKNLKFININLNNYENYDNSNINKTILPKSNLYIIFTSGSTGLPKGLCISHKNMVNLIFFEINKTPILEKGTIILQFATMSFDVSYQEIFSSLLSGNELVLISDEKRKNIDILVNYILKNKISTLFIPPTYLQLLIENNKNIEILSKCVKYIITAGESLTITENIKKLLKTGISLFNHYGPAETHVATTYKVPENIDMFNAPIGTPISNSFIYILDKNNNLCPFNTIGQIAIGGDCVGNGYIDKSLNKNKFVDNPFSEVSKLYLTGDLGFINSYGIVEFIGRQDFQVKINGFRIELDEINKIILDYKDIQSCITIINEINNKKYIFSYYTSNKLLNESDILTYLRKKLPQYMLPNKLIKLEKLPINNNGKIDRKALPIPSLNSENKFLPPTTKTQKRISKIWSEILNLENISINSDFFTIGGDSLLAIKLISYIKQEFNYDITIKDIFDNPDIEHLSLFIDNKKNMVTNYKIQKSKQKDHYPLSSAQKRIYYSCLKDNNSLLYNIAGGVVLDNKLDKEKLENCFKELIKRHSSLRTYFENKEDSIVQIIKDSVPFNLDYEEANTDNINDIYNNFVKPFNLSKAPLFRVKLTTLKNNKQVLLLDMHHIVSDGTSLNILINEVCRLYNGEKLPNKEIDYKDFAVWEQEDLQSVQMKKSKDFWVNQFKNDIPLLNMPVISSRPTVQSYEGSNHFITLNQTTYNQIIKTANQLNITPYMFLLSIYYILLSKYTSQDDIIVGTPVIGRSQKEISNILGMFVNSLPIRVNIDNNLTFKEFSKVVKDICTKAFNYQNYPFDILVNDLNIKRDTSRNPIFDTMFIYQSEGYPNISFQNINSEYFIPNNKVAKFDLSLEIIPINNEYTCRFEYCTKLFNTDFIKRFASHYINILNTIISNTETNISDIDMISEAEKEQILYSFNNTKVDYPSDKTIMELFEEQVRKTPNNICIVYEKQELTYQELNEKANKYARYLLANSIDSGSAVGIMLPKSLDIVVVMLAILKLHGTYILIDNTLPADRVKYMLENANTSVLITNMEHYEVNIENKLFIENNISELYDGNNFMFKFPPNDTIAILYTSGSTGTPKGVILHNKGFINLVQAHKIYMNTDKCDNFLSISSISFDMFQVEIWLPLLSGSKLFLTNEEEQKNPILLSRFIKENNINFILSTPSKFSLIFQDYKEFLPKLQVVQLGGEKLTKSTVNIIKKISNAHIYNAYGPTEITACCSCKEITDDFITIGKPICNMGIIILDKQNHILPIGVPGEICIYGDGVSNGYINNENLTNKSFITLPELNSKIYKSGDIGYLTFTGEIQYIDRVDNQIKLRGLRIELSEIKNVLLSYPDISSCHIIVKNNEYISAFVVSQTILDTRDIRNYLKSKLPLYMVPRYITQIESMPINTNGKIDSKALLNYPENIVINNYTKPETEKEKLFCNIWEELLHTKVGTTDDVFELGADSLLAINFKTILTKYNINVLYSDIFKYPKIKDLCNIAQYINNKDIITNYDYSKINLLLSSNDIKICNNYITSSNNNVLLLGANGFVGMHVLYSFIKNDTGKIFCLIRNKNNVSANKRFIDTLHFYFGTELDKYIGHRIFVICGNILKDNFALSDNELNIINNNIQIVINTASTVKHYGKEEMFEEINIGSVKNIVKYCMNNNKKLIHISSLSVSGNDALEGNHNLSFAYSFSEKNLYSGQLIDNLYVKSKFLSERYILENIPSGLDAQIYRLGNITNRYSDGKFQINPNTNAFVNKIKSIIKLKNAPKSLLDTYIEFTPVDSCADAIIKLMQNKCNSATIFHVYDNNHITISDFINILNEIGTKITIVDDKQFENIIDEKINENSQLVHSIINDFSDKKLSYKSNVSITSEFSRIFLKMIGFTWPNIDKTYIIKYMKYFYDINFF